MGQRPRTALQRAFCIIMEQQQQRSIRSVQQTKSAVRARAFSIFLRLAVSLRWTPVAVGVAAAVDPDAVFISKRYDMRCWEDPGACWGVCMVACLQAPRSSQSQGHGVLRLEPVMLQCGACFHLRHPCHNVPCQFSGPRWLTHGHVPRGMSACHTQCPVTATW